VAEVLEDGTQGLQPLDPQNHVGGAEREPVKVDVEVFAVDHDVHGMTTAGLLSQSPFAIAMRRRPVASRSMSAYVAACSSMKL
jgi:hypothetical protein